MLWLRNHLAPYEVTLKSLGLPEPEERKSDVPKLIEQELDFDKVNEQKKACESRNKMNEEQGFFFDDIIAAINQKKTLLFRCTRGHWQNFCVECTTLCSEK